MGNMLRAKETFWAPGNRRIEKGDLVAPDDPVVPGREGLLEEVVVPQAAERPRRGRSAKSAGKDEDG